MAERSWTRKGLAAGCVGILCETCLFEGLLSSLGLCSGHLALLVLSQGRWRVRLQGAWVSKQCEIFQVQQQQQHPTSPESRSAANTDCRICTHQMAEGGSSLHMRLGGNMQGAHPRQVGGKHPELLLQPGVLSSLHGGCSASWPGGTQAASDTHEHTRVLWS